MPFYLTPKPLARPPTLYIALLLSICLLSLTHAQDCSPQSSDCPSGPQLFPNFTFSLIGDFVRSVQRIGPGVMQFDIRDDSDVIRYQVVQCGCDPGELEDNSDIIRIFTQPNGVYADSGPILGLYLALFPEADRLAQVNRKTNVFSGNVRNRIDAGNTTETNTPRGRIPDRANFDPNVITALIPLEAALDYVTIRSRNSNVTAALAIPIDRITEPLQLAECIKLIALLFDRLDEATQMFSDLQSEYNRIKELATNLAIRRPSVFFNYPSLDPEELPSAGSSSQQLDPEEAFTWEQPRPNSYLTNLVADASAEFNQAEDVVFSYNQTLARFRSSRFLLNSGRNDVFSNSRDIRDFLDEPVDERLVTPDGSFLDRTFNDEVARDLTAVVCGNVWSNQNRFRDLATDFDEAGAFQPDRILIDFIRILHPYIRAFDSTDIRFQYRYEESDAGVFLPQCPFVTLDGNPPRGRTFVTLQYRIDLNRFDIEDSADDVIENIQTDLPGLDIGQGDIELFFPARLRDTTSTGIRVKVAVPIDRVDLLSSDQVLRSLRRSFSSTEVRQETVPSVTPSPTPSISPSPPPPTSNQAQAGSGGGLGGGAIFGIVVAVLVVVGLVIFCLTRQRRRSHQPMARAAAGQSDPGWVGGAESGVPPGQAGASGGRQDRNRFRPRMNFGRSAPVPPHPDGTSGAANDDPFI